MSEIKPIRERMKNLQKGHNSSTISVYNRHSDDAEEKGDAIIGDIAELYLRKFAYESGADKTFRLLDKVGKFSSGIRT